MFIAISVRCPTAIFILRANCLEFFKGTDGICLIIFSLSSVEHAPMTLSWAFTEYLLTLSNDW